MNNNRTLPSRCIRPFATGHFLALIALTIVAGPIFASPNPGYDRPGIGFAPAVLEQGDITWEQGVPDFSHDGDATRYTADALVRLGLGGNFEAQLGTSYNRLSYSGDSLSGRGDTSLGLKFATQTAGPLSWGVLGSITFTDGASSFGGSDRQFLLGAAFNWQLNPRDSLGAYLETVRSGGDGDQLAAFNAGRALSDSLGVYAEVAWQHVTGSGNGTMAGGGITWQATPRIQFDASFRHRLGGEIDTWQGGIGFSVFFDRS